MPPNCRTATPPVGGVRQRDTRPARVSEDSTLGWIVHVAPAPSTILDVKFKTSPVKGDTGGIRTQTVVGGGGGGGGGTKTTAVPGFEYPLRFPAMSTARARELYP